MDIRRLRAATGAVCALLAIGLFVSDLPAATGIGNDTQEDPGAQSATTVSLEMYLIDLVDINGSDQTFLADVLVVARWHDPSLASAVSGARTIPREDVWSPTLLTVNQRNVTSSLPDVVRVDGEGNVQYSRRVTGTFSARMDLRAFPRDRQTFDVWIVSPEFGGQRVALVPYDSTTVLRSDSFSISDWELAEPVLEAREYRVTGASDAVSGVSLRFEARRLLGYYVIQVLLPLSAVVLMAWTVFWIDPAVVTTRVSVVVTTMLTLIAYRFMLGNLVPRLSYLTRLDYFMLCVTSMVILTLLSMGATAFLMTRKREDIVRRIDRTGRIAFPVILATVTLAVWVL